MVSIKRDFMVPSKWNAPNDCLQLRRAISIQAEGTRLLEKHAVAPSAASTYRLTRFLFLFCKPACSAAMKTGLGAPYTAIPRPLRKPGISLRQRDCLRKANTRQTKPQAD